MNLPGIETYARGDNARAVTLTTPSGNTLKLWYSYATPVAFAMNGARCVRVNQWGPTTGAHLRAIDGGDANAKRARVEPEEFERRLTEAMAKLETPDGFDKKCRALGFRALAEIRERNLFAGRTDPHGCGMARDGMRAIVAEARAMGLDTPTLGAGEQS